MSSVVISGDTSGAITLSAPAVSGTNTATLPAATGTVMVSGNMPAFSGYTNSQAISANTETLIAYNTENFDTANAFSTSTYLFTAPVAGYYQFNVYIGWTTTISANESYAYIQKNSAGTAIMLYDLNPATYYGLGGSALLQASAGDTFGVKVYQNNGTKTIGGTYFSGCLVRTS